MKVIRVHEAARRESNQATVWYAERSRPLALKFRDELLAAIASAATDPLRYPSYLFGTRRVLLKTFPYLIVFFDWKDEIYVVAVAHGKRDAGYWKGRIKTI